MKKLLLAGAAVFMLSGSGAWAQKFPVYASTGTMDVVMDGKAATYHTTSNTVPNQPGRMIHTGKWKIFAPMMMGGMNMAPPGMFVSLSARPKVKPDQGLPDLKITFSLDQDRHTLLDSAPFEVVYTIKDGPAAGEYQHAEGSLRIESATLVEPDVLEISGRAAGKLRRGKGKGGKGDSDRTLNYDATFTVQAHRY